MSANVLAKFLAVVAAAFLFAGYFTLVWTDSHVTTPGSLALTGVGFVWMALIAVITMEATNDD